MIAKTGADYRHYIVSNPQVIPIEPVNELSLSDPRCLAIDALTNELYVGETYQEHGSVMAVTIEDETATCVLSITAGLARPSGIAFTQSYIFVSDSFTNSLLCYSKTGELLYEVGTSNDMDFFWPTSVRCNLGIVYICDWGNGRIVAFDTSLNHLFHFKEDSICPIDMTIHSNCLFVVTQKLILAVFTLEGDFITVIPLKLPKFNRIKAFAIDCAGNFTFTSPQQRFIYFANLEVGELMELNIFDIFSFTHSAIGVYRQDKIISLSNSGVQLFNIF